MALIFQVEQYNNNIFEFFIAFIFASNCFLNVFLNLTGNFQVSEYKVG